MLRGGAFYLSIGTNRQIVYARLSGVNICSLQIEHRSAVSFSIGTIGTNGTNRQIVYTRPSGVNICSLQIEHRSAASFSIGAIGTNDSIGEGFLTIGICLRILDMCVTNNQKHYVGHLLKSEDILERDGELQLKRIPADSAFDKSISCSCLHVEVPLLLAHVSLILQQKPLSRFNSNFRNHSR